MKFSIDKKLIGGFLIVSFIFVSASGISYFYIKKVNDSYADLLNRRAVIESNAKEIQNLSLMQTNAMRGYLLTQNSGFLSDLQNANNQLFPPFSKLNLAKIPNINGKTMPALFCKILINNYFRFFVCKNGKISGHDRKKHSLHLPRKTR